MTSVARRRLPRSLIIMLVILLTAAMVVAMADPSEARRLPRHRRRQVSAGADGAAPAIVAFDCVRDVEAVEYSCNGERLTITLGASGNPIPNQMSATPSRFTCAPAPDAPPDPQPSDFECAFPHRPRPIEFRLSEMGTYVDEEDVEGDQCAETPPDALVGECQSVLPPHDHDVKVQRVVHSPVGEPDDSVNERLNRERVILHNPGESAFPIGSAQLMQVPETGDPVQRYRLPPGTTLDVGQQLVIHTGKGQNRPGHLYIGRSSQLWRRTDHVLLTSRRGHHLTQCIYVSDDGAGIDCTVAPE